MLKRCWIVICTRNRESSLNRLLTSIINSDLQTIEGLIVVDSSDNPISINSPKKLNESEIEFVLLKSYVQNLAYQRNCALNFLATRAVNLIHFLDDDVEVDFNYFNDKYEIFRNEGFANTAIVGGIECNPGAHFQSHKVMFAKLRRNGRVTKSGINHKVYDLKSRKNVDWVSGMMLTVNYPLVSTLRFSENLLGNSVGEDVIYSLKAKEFGRIIVDPNIHVIHHHESSGRCDDLSNRVSFNFYRIELVRLKLKAKKRHVFMSLVFSQLKYLFLYLLTGTIKYKNFAMVDNKSMKSLILGQTLRAR